MCDPISASVNPNPPKTTGVNANKAYTLKRISEMRHINVLETRSEMTEVDRTDVRERDLDAAAGTRSAYSGVIAYSDSLEREGTIGTSL